MILVLRQVCSPSNANVGLLAYSPLAGGSLTGKYQDGGDTKSRFNLFPGQETHKHMLSLLVRCTYDCASGAM